MYSYRRQQLFQVANTYFTVFLEGFSNPNNEREEKSLNRIKVRCTALSRPLCNSKVAIYALGIVPSFV